MKKKGIYYQAIRKRNEKWDGKFFYGVKTTGIYCRPICPAKPKKENIEFFSTALEAEKSGYRACLRCRPDTIPHSPAWLGKTAVVGRALKYLQQEAYKDFHEEAFALRFGLSARHLRRLFVEATGKTPKQIAMQERLLAVKKNLQLSEQTISEIAWNSGFKSLRRFNAAVQEYFHTTPSQIRKRK